MKNKKEIYEKWKIEAEEEKPVTEEMYIGDESLKEELENSRIQLMIKQLQPHFLYNTLSAIQAIVTVDPDYAYHMLYAFTVHLKSSIKALSNDQPIGFAQEYKHIQAYLDIEKMRFGSRLKVLYDVTETDFLVMPLSIQTFVENAVRHGIFPNGDKGGMIQICAFRQKEDAVVVIKDNGVGFETKGLTEEQDEELGISNTVFRLESILDAKVNLVSHKGKGTKVTIRFRKGVEKDENHISR